MPGDVVIEADRKKVRAPADLARIAGAVKDRPLLLRVVRNQGAVFVVVPPAESGD